MMNVLQGVKTRIRPGRFLSVALVLGTLSACESVPDWIGEEEDAPLPGQRISVLAHKAQLQADPEGEKIVIQLPAPKANEGWYMQHQPPVEHAYISPEFSASQDVSAGDGPNEGLRLTAGPVIANGLVFTIDGDGNVIARRVESLDDVVWEMRLPRGEVDGDLLGFGVISTGREEKDFLGGNIAFSKGHLYLSTAHGDVVKLNAANGEKVWTRSVKLPIRSAPVVDGQHVYVVTSDNRLYALEKKSGNTVWTHDGIAETTSIFGAPSPVVNGELIVVPYSSGELHVMEAETGKPRWDAILISKTRGRTSGMALNDIESTPVVYQGSVYAISHDGVLSAFNLDTGRKRWELEVASVNTPWLAGDFMYLITLNNELVCVHTAKGKVKWVAPLPGHTEVSFDWGGDAKGEKILWSGPVLAQNRLLMAGSHGQLIIASPYSGTITANYDIPENTYLPPVVADQRVFTLSNDAVLNSWR